MNYVRAPAPVRSRPVNRKDGPTKPTPGRGGKPPSGTAATKRPDSRFNKAGSKEDKSTPSSSGGKSSAAAAAAAKKDAAKQDDTKDEKIVEEEKDERRFDSGGYDKDLVDMLGNKSINSELDLFERWKLTSCVAV